MQQKNFQEQKELLQNAIEELEVFTEPSALRFHIGDNGKMVSVRGSRLERMVGVARSYIIPLFFGQARQEHEKRILKLKKA